MTMNELEKQEHHSSFDHCRHRHRHHHFFYEIASSNESWFHPKLEQWRNSCWKKKNTQRNERRLLQRRHQDQGRGNVDPDFKHGSLAVHQEMKLQDSSLSSSSPGDETLKEYQWKTQEIHERHQQQEESSVRISAGILDIKEIVDTYKVRRWRRWEDGRRWAGSSEDEGRSKSERMSRRKTKNTTKKQENSSEKEDTKNQQESRIVRRIKTWKKGSQGRTRETE